MLSKEEHNALRQSVKEGLTKAAIVKTLGINRRTAQTGLKFGVAMLAAAKQRSHLT